MHQHILLRIIYYFYLFLHWSSQGSQVSPHEHDILPDSFMHFYPGMNVFSADFVAVAVGFIDWIVDDVFVGDCNVALLLEYCLAMEH